MSLVLPNAKEKYERREEQNFREWVRRNVENAANLAQNAGGGTGDVFVGDSGSGGAEGIVPAPATGDATKFLKGDGTWAAPSGLVGAVAWGAITGTLTDQTDLDTALDGKSDTSHTHAYSSLTGIPATFAPSAHSHSAFTGDSGAGGAVGFVPAPVAGDAAAGKYLDADGTWTVPPVGGGGAAWGTITGTLSAQSDLITALAGKSDTSHTHAYSSLTSIPSTFAPSAHTHPWADVTGEPTTLAGYGIVDAAALVHTHPWADVTGEPTTLAGYGITDAAPLVHTHAWADVTGEPTTLAGYGITDAAPLVHTHAWADVTGEPTTLAGYGVSNAHLSTQPCWSSSSTEEVLLLLPGSRVIFTPTSPEPSRRVSFLLINPGQSSSTSGKTPTPISHL